MGYGKNRTPTPWKNSNKNSIKTKPLTFFPASHKFGEKTSNYPSPGPVCIYVNDCFSEYFSKQPFAFKEVFNFPTVSAMCI